MFDLTRRECLIQLSRSLSLACAAFTTQLPAGFSTPAMPACDPATKPTPARAPVPVRKGAPGRRLTLEGAVIGLRCGFVAGAAVTVSAGDAPVKAVTDASGRYRVTLVLPKTTGAARVNVRVDVPKKTTLTTVLFLPDEIARAENKKAAGFDPLLRMKLIKQSAGEIHASFDVILDL